MPFNQPHFFFARNYEFDIYFFARYWGKDCGIYRRLGRQEQKLKSAKQCNQAS